jgi:hypothetical protein
MSHISKFVLALAAFAVLGVAAVPARADIVFIQGPTSAADENIQFNSPGLISTGNPVTGATNQTNTVFNFSSNVNLTTPSAGQARIERAGGGTFNTLTITPVNPLVTFNELDFNINAVANGFVTFTATEDNGQVTTSQVFSLDASGQNFFSLTAINNQRIRIVMFTTTVGIQDVRQVRVGGIATGTPTAPIPEPMTLLLFGTGLAGVAARLRRRCKS